MELSIFLAKFLGFYCVLIAIAMLINATRFKAFILENANNTSIILFSGILALIFGLLIVLAHNIWVGWPILITLIGWLALLKGVTRLYFSDGWARYTKVFAENNYYYAAVLFTLILGLVLLYFGFFMA